MEGNLLNHLMEDNQAGLLRSIAFERITRPYPLPHHTQTFSTYQILRLKPLWFQTRRFFMFSIDGPLRNMCPLLDLIIIIIRLLCRCAAVPAHEAYIAHTAHPVLCTHLASKKEFGLYPALILRLSALS